MNWPTKMQQFLELFYPNPGNSYLFVTTTLDEVAEALYEKISAVDGRFHIALYGKATPFHDCKVESIDDFSKPFHAAPRDHDRVIFYDIFSKHASQTMLLKLAYRTLANAAEVIIVEKRGNLNTESTKELLEANEFRAANVIEDILPNYDVFVAKKMHMWGNGL